MHLHWIGANDCSMFDEPMASAYLRIIALFLVSLPPSKSLQGWLDIGCASILRNYACLRYFSLDEIVSKLQDDAIRLRNADIEAQLRIVANRTFYPQNLEAICAALELLREQNLICETVWHMLSRMASALSISDADLDGLIARFF